MLNAKSTRKVLCVLLLAVFALSLVATSPVLAYLYRATFTVSNNGSTDYTALPVTCSPVDVDWLIANGFITTATALDTRVETLGGTDQLHMMAEDRIMSFCPSLASDSQLNWYLSTGNSALSSFPVITGYGGNVTVVDVDALEPANNFSIEFEGWIDTTTSNPTLSFPTVEATNTSDEDTYTSSHTIDLPSGVESGDLLIIVFSGYGTLALHTVAWPPAGWTSLADKGGNSNHHLGIAYKVATGGEGSNVTVTTSNNAFSAHNSFRISGYEGVPEISCDPATTGSANPNPPSLTPSWGYKNTLWIAGFGAEDHNLRTLDADPANYSNELFIVGGNAGDSRYAYAGTVRREYYAATENPGAFTMSGTVDWYGFTVAVQGAIPTSGGYITKGNGFYIYPDEGTVNVAVFGAGGLKQVTTSGTSSDSCEVNVWGNGTDLGIDIDGVTENTTALGGVSVPNNANNWIISSIPYFNYYKHSVNGTLVAWYQPISYIVGTTLPDREGAAQNGNITWGTNPAGVNVTLGSLTAPESTVVIEEEESGYQGAMHNVGVTDWFLEPDVGTKLATHPFRPLVTIWSDNSTVTEVQAWRFLGLALLLLITVVAAVMVRGHLLIAGLACGGTIALLVQQTVWPGWTLVFIIPAIIAGVMAERTPSIG